MLIIIRVIQKLLIKIKQEEEGFAIMVKTAELFNKEDVIFYMRKIKIILTVKEKFAILGMLAMMMNVER